MQKWAYFDEKAPSCAKRPILSKNIASCRNLFLQTDRFVQPDFFDYTFAARPVQVLACSVIYASRRSAIEWICEHTLCRLCHSLEMISSFRSRILWSICFDRSRITRRFLLTTKNGLSFIDVLGEKFDPCRYLHAHILRIVTHLSKVAFICCERMWIDRMTLSHRKSRMLQLT